MRLVYISREASSFSRFALVQLVVVNHSLDTVNILFHLTSPGLAILSGLFFSLSYKDARSKIKSIAQKIVTPYLCVNLLYFIVYYFGKTIVAESGLSGAYKRPPPTFSITGLIEGITVNPANGPYWFLRDLIIAQTAAVLVFKLPAKLRFFQVTLIFIIACVWMPTHRFFTPFVGGLLFGQVLRFDCFEHPIYKIKELLNQDSSKSLLGFFSLFVFCVCNRFWHYFPLLSNLIGGGALLLFFLTISILFKDSNPEFFEMISFWVFSFHAMVIGSLKLLVLFFGLRLDFVTSVLIYIATNILILISFATATKGDSLRKKIFIP
jgi:hypothetical protein